jgi:hypothetical protein
LSPEIRAACRAAAPARHGELSMARHARELAALYDEITRARGRSAGGAATVAAPPAEPACPQAGWREPGRGRPGSAELGSAGNGGPHG